MQNNIAVTDILLHGTPSCPEPDPHLLDEADRFSAQARRDLPWETFTLGTRGCVCIELGRIAAGKAQVEQALREHEDARSKAFCVCFLAIAAARQGHFDVARSQVDAATELDPDCIALPKALAALSSASSRSAEDRSSDASDIEPDASGASHG
jgi:hypothetical protein